MNLRFTIYDLRFGWRAQVVTSVCLAAAIIGVVLNTRQFLISYLFAYLFWLSLTLGCFGVAMIHHLTGGRWGFVTRRFLEAGFMTLPVFAILFVPIFFGLRELYPWANPHLATASDIAGLKRSYLSSIGFIIRAILFLAIFVLMTIRLRHWSLQQDKTTDPALTIKMRMHSGPGIVIFPLIATFAFVDWIMSAEPKWYSTIFPLIILIGQVLIAFSIVTVLLAAVRDQPPFNAVVTPKHFHDLGNLLLAFVIFWTYVSFGQLLVIYSGNLPQEIGWYLHRISGGWQFVIGALALFHFFAPFFLLLFRGNKLNVPRLALIAAMIFVAHVVEVFWIVEPSFFPKGVHVHWLDFATLFALGGIWFAVFFANLRKHPLLPRNDPRIEYSVAALENAR
jgi:hypothetical protein